MTKNATNPCHLRDFRPASIPANTVLKEIVRLYGKRKAVSKTRFYEIERGNINPRTDEFFRIVNALRALTGRDFSADDAWQERRKK